MAKMMSKDSQIILNMMRIQDTISEILDAEDDKVLVTKNKKIDLLTYYIIKLFSMRKNFSSKTKKALGMFDDFKGASVMKSLNYCYPMISPQEIINIARNLSDVDSRDALSKQYGICIQESTKYEAE